MKARRLPVVDEFVDGHETAVFVDGHVLVLSVVASAVLHAVGDTWTDLSDIAKQVVGAVGAPPERTADDAVTAVLLELAARNVIETNK